jgi:hypothetical protein
VPNMELLFYLFKIVLVNILYSINSKSFSGKQYILTKFLSKLMARQDHFYPNLPKPLGEVIDTCVSTILKGGTLKYQDRKDFIVKSIQNQIEKEKQRNPILQEKLSKIKSSAEVVVINNSNNSRGNRIHDKVRNK